LWKPAMRDEVCIPYSRNCWSCVLMAPVVVHLRRINSSAGCDAAIPTVSSLFLEILVLGEMENVSALMRSRLLNSRLLQQTFRGTFGELSRNLEFKLRNFEFKSGQGRAVEKLQIQIWARRHES
jgi:hypothetical protein